MEMTIEHIAAHWYAQTAGTSQVMMIQGICPCRPTHYADVDKTRTQRVCIQFIPPYISLIERYVEAVKAFAVRLVLLQVCLRPYRYGTLTQTVSICHNQALFMILPQTIARSAYKHAGSEDHDCQRYYGMTIEHNMCNDSIR